MNIKKDFLNTRVVDISSSLETEDYRMDPLYPIWRTEYITLQRFRLKPVSEGYRIGDREIFAVF